MGGIFGSGDPNSEQKPQYTGLSIQTSARGMIIPVVYGQTRIPFNLLWYGNFQSYKHEEDVGKGGSSTITSYTYSVGVILGLCEGPILDILKMWKDKIIDTDLFGGTKYLGSYTQNADSWLLAYKPDEALTYRGTAYVINDIWDLGGSANLPQYSFEVKGLLGDNGDVNPADVIIDVLTNTKYGAHFPSVNLASLDLFRTYCKVVDLYISPAFTSQRRLSEYLEDIMKACNTAPRWSQGILDIIPYGDIEIMGGGETYTPPVACFDFTDDDFLDKDEPIKLIRKRSADIHNVIKVEYLDRAFQYAPDIASTSILDAIRRYNLLQAPTYQFHFFCLASRAMRSSQLLLQREQIRNTYKSTLGWKHIVHDPMDTGYITDAKLGLDKQKVRITEIEEDENGDLTFTFEEMIDELGTAEVYGKESGHETEDPNALPGDCYPPVIFEPPKLLSRTWVRSTVWMVVSGGDNWGGCNVWISLDGATYQKIGVYKGQGKTGILRSLLPSGDKIDLVNTLAVNLDNNSLQLLNTSDEEWELLLNLCYVDGELISYKDAELIAAGDYDLTSLKRGCYGTSISSHAQGTQFARLNNVFREAYNEKLIGQTIYIKLQSFNRYFSALQNLDDLTPYEYTLIGSTSRPPSKVGLDVKQIPAGNWMAVYVTIGEMVLGEDVYIRDAITTGEAGNNMPMSMNMPINKCAGICLIDSAPATYGHSRYDLIVIDYNLIFDVIKGVESTSPIMPAIPAGHTCCGWVKVRYGMTKIIQTDINV